METYRDWLKVEFETRCKRNSSYSLRAFARDLKLFPSHMSDILNGKQGLSRKSAANIVEQLKLPPHEKSLFLIMVDAEHSRNPEQRKRAQERLEQMRNVSESQRVSTDAFNVISDWYHFAILDLAKTVDFRSSETWVASRLGISELEVERAVQRLVSTGLLKIEDGRWIPTRQFPSVYSNVPSVAIKRYHAQLLEKGKKALQDQPLDLRDFSSMSIPIDPADVEELKEDIRLFRRTLDQKYKLRPNKRAVYALCVQLFSLTRLSGDERNREAVGVVNA